MIAAIVATGAVLGLIAYFLVGLLWAAPRRALFHMERRGGFRYRWRSEEQLARVRQEAARAELASALVTWPADALEIACEALIDALSRFVERRTPICEDEADERRRVRVRHLKDLQQATDRLRTEQEGADGRDR